MADSLAAPVFDIQRFSIHDGPGIRTTVFLKGCLLDCIWCQNPESKSRQPVIAFYANRCLKGFECRSVCPEGAILDGDFRVNYDKCANCGLCIEACPSGALKRIGDAMTAEELFALASRDKEFFMQSGGGITLSGGEPTMHADFLVEFLRLCRAAGIHTLLQTSGYFRRFELTRLLPLFDRIYFDLKLFDAAAHRKFTGGSNAVILRNASVLAALRAPVEFRIPLVQEITDSEENLSAIARFLLDHGVASVQLLKYHNMGEAKIDIVRSAQPRLNKPTYPETLFARKKDFLESKGLTVFG